MAKKQTRRSISVNRSLFERAKAQAKAEDISLSKMTEEALEARLAPQPKSTASAEHATVQ